MNNLKAQWELIPDSLTAKIRPIVKTDESVAAWGQAFKILIRPKSDTLPHPHAMADQLDHKYDSKGLIDKIHELGSAEPYK